MNGEIQLKIICPNEWPAFEGGEMWVESGKNVQPHGALCSHIIVDIFLISLGGEECI